MSTPSPQAARQRGKRGTTPNPDSKMMNGNADQTLDQLKAQAKETVKKDWDYKVALTVITILAFITRFWGISHPNQVVFDEVHFGKVGSDHDMYSSIDPSHETIRLINAALVRLLLPPTNILLRCPPSFWQAPLRLCRLARRLRWLLPLREHRRLLYYQQGALRRLPQHARAHGVPHCQHSILDHVGVRIQLASVHCRCWNSAV